LGSESVKVLVICNPILKRRSTKYNPVPVKGGDGGEKPGLSLKHLGLFSTKEKASKNIRLGTDVGCRVSGGTGIGDRLGSADGIEGKGGNISIRKNGRCTWGSWFRFLGNLWVVLRRLREIV
jgi:hypothetical protein